MFHAKHPERGSAASELSRSRGPFRLQEALDGKLSRVGKPAERRFIAMFHVKHSETAVSEPAWSRYPCRRFEAARNEEPCQIGDAESKTRIFSMGPDLDLSGSGADADRAQHARRFAAGSRDRFPMPALFRRNSPERFRWRQPSPNLERESGRAASRAPRPSKNRTDRDRDQTRATGQAPFRLVAMFHVKHSDCETSEHAWSRNPRRRSQTRETRDEEPSRGGQPGIQGPALHQGTDS